MEILIFLVIIVVIVFINIKISDFKHRTKQQVLRNTGISSSEINAGITESFEKKHLQKFLQENPSFTEESIKDLLKQYTVQIINRNSIEEFSEAVNEKMKKDSKLQKISNMQFKRVNINYYINSNLNAVVVYADNRDEYNFYLRCTVKENKIQLNKYQISKGEVLGF